MSLRVALLGIGSTGARHAAAAQKVEGVRLVAACGREMARAEEFAGRFGISAYTDFERMLGSESLDLLIIALPPFAHNGQAELAAAHNVNLLVEKPIALDLGRAGNMVEASGKVVAACGFMYRFGGAVERWTEMTAAGETGCAGHFSGSFHSNALHASWWRDREKSGGQMVEQLIHIADLARCWLGRPQTVYARSANFFHREMPGYSAEDLSAILLGYENGRIGVLHASNGAVPGRWMKAWQVVSERATGLFADWNNAEIVRTAGAAGSERVASVVDPFVAQLEDVRDAIIDGRPPRVPLGDGLETLRIVLAARRSADERREVAL